MLFLPCSWGLARTNIRRGTRYVLLSVGAQNSNTATSAAYAGSRPGQQLGPGGGWLPSADLGFGGGLGSAAAFLPANPHFAPAQL